MAPERSVQVAYWFSYVTLGVTKVMYSFLALGIYEATLNHKT